MSESLFVMFRRPGDNQEMIRDNPGKQETNSEKMENSTFEGLMWCGRVVRSDSNRQALELKLCQNTAWRNIRNESASNLKKAFIREIILKCFWKFPHISVKGCLGHKAPLPHKKETGEMEEEGFAP